jgi:DNA repair photolyase
MESSKPKNSGYYQSPRWTGEVADCSMPMTFDQYSNCSFGCVYCFSQYQRAIGGAKSGYIDHEMRAVSVEKIKKIFSGGSSQFSDYIAARKVMQWGGLSDPFCNYERERGIGLELLKFFKDINYPICFSTKGVWWLKDSRYTDLFRGQKNWNVKVSIITLDQKKAAKIEKGVPSPEARLQAIQEIALLQCGGATLRLRPFIVGISNPHHTILIRRAGLMGATALSTEFFCLERRSTHFKEKGLPIMSECAGFDLSEFYRRLSISQGYLRLNRSVKKQFIDEMEWACQQAGMRFYVSDAHFKERCANGSCCGLGPEWNYSRGQFCEALLLCKKNGRVTWPEIAKDMEHLSNVPFICAQGFNCNSSEKRAQFRLHSLKGYLRWCWNNPKAGQSPYTMFEGIMRPGGKDEQGNLVYEYDDSRG